MSRGHETLEHPADMGIRGWGPTPAEALEEVAGAMFGLVADIDAIGEDEAVRIEAAGRGLDELMIEFLNALISEADLHEMVFKRVEVEQIVEREETCYMRAVASGRARSKCTGKLHREVKAATWYGASFTEHDDGSWIAECIVDL